jgi:hypothetical protein
MNEVDRQRYEALAANLAALEPEDLDALTHNALLTATSMLRIMTGETLAQFSDEGRLLALGALLDVAQEQLNHLRCAIAADLITLPAGKEAGEPK